jgi:hypothetical protein
MLYQALVDRLAPAIEGALATRAQVMAYRQTLDEDASNPFAGTPSFVDYADRVDQIIDEQIPSPRLLSPFDRTGPKRPGYVLSTDLSGYFMHIDVDELERSLLALSSPTDVVRDLGDLLRFWRFAGVRGLPQGVRASSPLANLYLAPLDSLLTEMGVAWVRSMDDITVTARKYADARQILDAAEKLLYQRGLTLNSAKTSIKRANPEASPIPPDALVRRKETTRFEIAALIEAGYMDPADAPEPAEIDQELAVEELDGVLDEAEKETLPARFQSRVVSALRDLEDLGVAHRVDEMALVIARAPDLTYVVLRYVASMAAADAEGAIAVFLKSLGAERFLREHEKLAVCKAALAMPPAPSLALPFASLAAADASQLVRARALLAWGAHSADDDFSVADTFWGRQRQAPGRHMPWSRFSESRATNATLGTSDGAARGGTSAT